MPYKGRKKNVPSFKKKSDVIRHGYIMYGKTKSGARKFRVYYTKEGWNVIPK